MKKKVAIITSVSVAILLAALIVILCVLLAPRNLKGLIPEDGAIQVAVLASLDNHEVYRMNEQEAKTFWEQLKKTKYKPQTDLLKGRSELQVSIEYKDGSKIIFDEFKLTKYNSGGKIIKVTPIKASMYVFDEYKDKLA